jgi:hypothetical protein
LLEVQILWPLPGLTDWGWALNPEAGLLMFENYCLSHVSVM